MIISLQYMANHDKLHFLPSPAGKYIIVVSKQQDDATYKDYAIMCNDKSLGVLMHSMYNHMIIQGDQFIMNAIEESINLILEQLQL